MVLTKLIKVKYCALIVKCVCIIYRAEWNFSKSLALLYLLKMVHSLMQFDIY